MQRSLETKRARRHAVTRLCVGHIATAGAHRQRGSIAGRQAMRTRPSTSIEVSAVRGFTYALREDLLGRPIRLTLVDPGLVESGVPIVRLPRRHRAAKETTRGSSP